MPAKSATAQSDESKLWTEVLQGKRQALASLFHLYHQALLTYGYRINSNEEFIEDCIQELFLTIWEKHDAISEAKSVKAYLFISMRRTIFKNLRKQKNQQHRNFKYAEEKVNQSISIEDLLIEIECQNEYQKKLEAAFNSLSKRGREVIYLKYYNGMSNSEIASLMNIQRQSVYNHVSEAISEMQQLVK